MPLSLEDRQAVQDLMVRYAYALDIDGTEEDLVALFTENAVMDSPISGHNEGIEGIRNWARRAQTIRKTTQLRHYITNFLIDGDGDRATLKAYFVELMTYRDPVLPKTERTTEFLFAGNYDCVMRKVDGKWKFERRTVYVDAVPRAKREKS